jgi:signal peptidase I
MEATIMAGEVVVAAPTKYYQRNDVVVYKIRQGNTWQTFVKRLCGMPGDIVKLNNDSLYVNGKPVPEPKTIQHAYIFYTRSNVPLKPLDENEYQPMGMNGDENSYRIFLTREKAEEIKHMNGVDRIEKLQDTASNSYVLGSTLSNHWSLQQWGPAEVPKKGKAISITKHNYAVYRNILKDYEMVTLDSNRTQNYTFKNDYVFLLGDNRENAVDSRMFGFLPMSLLKGVIMGK